jgi:hypothetical protein
MCEPMTIMALSSAALSVAGSVKSHNAQAGAFDDNTKAAHAAKVEEDRMAQEDSAVTDQAAAQEKIDRGLEGMKSSATALTSAGESGVSGNSIDALMNELDASVLRGNTTTTQNLELSQRGTQRQLASNKRTAQSRINSVAKPSKSATALSIAGTLASTAASYGTATAPKK